MSKQFYLPGDDKGKSDYLTLFAAKLATYAALLGITPAELASAAADAEAFKFAVLSLKAYKDFVEGYTQTKNILRDKEGTPLAAWPTLPPVPAPPALVPAGIFKRNARLVGRIKKNDNYNDQIGKDMGIIGAETPELDPATLKPVIKAVIVSGGHPELQWNKPQGIDGIHFFVKRSTGAAAPSPGTPGMPAPTPVGATPAGFVFLASDTEPNYIDTAALPAQGETAIWTYLAIYFRNGENIGQYSAEVKVTVTGVV
jgi:hypothetical protein